MRVVEHPFSEFLRQPNEVIAELDDHDVVLRRRNAPPLRLSAATRDEERAQAFDAAARLLRHLLVHRAAGLDDALEDVFPWSAFLPKRDRAMFVDELGLTLVAASAIDNYVAIAQLIREWRATAEIYADPRLARRLRRAANASGDRISEPEV
jgi:hypothetical protein